MLQNETVVLLWHGDKWHVTTVTCPWFSIQVNLIGDTENFSISSPVQFLGHSRQLRSCNILIVIVRVILARFSQLRKWSPFCITFIDYKFKCTRIYYVPDRAGRNIFLSLSPQEIWQSVQFRPYRHAFIINKRNRSEQSDMLHKLWSGVDT